MAIKLGRLVTCNEELPFIKLRDLQSHDFERLACQIEYFIFPLELPIATKHGKMTTYLGGLPP